VGLVTNNFEPTKLLQVSHAERPVVDEVEVTPLLVVKVQRLLGSSISASVSPTLTVKPFAESVYVSLTDNNTVLTVVVAGRVIVKLQSAPYDDIKT
jgi:hypothetical protein